MVPEAPLEETPAGRIPVGEGWFVLNLQEARWYAGEGRAARTDLEGDAEFPQLGIHVIVLEPGIPIGMYHWEADQEDFLVLSGEGVLIAEGEERPLRTWDLVHCPSRMKHMIVGAGEEPCVVLAVGARTVSGEGWGGYTVDEVAARYDVSVEQDTTSADEAYARFTPREPTRYREGWLPDGA